MKRLLITNISVASLAALPVPAEAQRGGERHREWGPQCVVYEHANYAGQSREVRDGEPVQWVGNPWNDRISSVRCRPGCALIAFEHINFGGEREFFRGEVPFVGPRWNDRISAMRVTCGRRTPSW